MQYHADTSAYMHAKKHKRQNTSYSDTYSFQLIHTYCSVMVKIGLLQECSQIHDKVVCRIHRK